MSCKAQLETVIKMATLASCSKSLDSHQEEELNIEVIDAHEYEQEMNAINLQIVSRSRKCYALYTGRKVAEIRLVSLVQQSENMDDFDS